jgi:hypothetical protein
MGKIIPEKIIPVDLCSEELSPKTSVSDMGKYEYRIEKMHL